MTAPTEQITAANYLIGRSCKIEAAIALCCVLYSESELKPVSQGDQSTEYGGILNPKGAFGIASWNGVRQARLAAFAKKRGMDYNLLTTQLYFVLNEIANYYPASWAAVRSDLGAEAIIPTLVADYEDPADHAKEINKAMGYVEPLRAALKALPPEPAEPPTPAPQPAPAPVQGTSMPIASLLSILAPIVESIVTGVLNAHGIKAPAAAPPAPIVIAPAPPPPAPAAPQIDMTQLAALIAKELASLGINVKV